jgi:aminopeptidase YwaD
LDLKTQLTQHLQQIIRERDPYLASEGHFYVGEYIRQQFQQWGTVITDEFQMPGRIHDVVPGSRGADDNATGIAVLLALARGIAEQPP